MASQTPGALRAEGSGAPIPYQMAAGTAQVSHPRFDAPPRNRNDDLAPPLIANNQSFGTGTSFAHHGGPYHRYSLPNSLAPPISTTLPPFVSQKSATDTGYSLPFGSDPPNMNGLAPSQAYNYRTTSSSSSSPLSQHRSSPTLLSPVSAGSGNHEGPGSWSSVYAMQHQPGPAGDHGHHSHHHYVSQHQHYSTILPNGMGREPATESGNGV